MERKFKLFDTPFKKAVAIITALSLLGAGIGYALSKKSKKPAPQYYTVSMDTVKKGEKQASLFNVGNYKVKGKSELKDLVKASKKGVPAGAIINTIASTKGEILLDGEYAKSLVENTDVDYPIYLDVTGLLKNRDLRVDEILQLISSFCSKLTANGMFVGIYGSEEDIKKLSDYDDNKILNAYDVLYKNDNPEINLEYGNMIKTDEEGLYTTKEDIKSIINANGLNNEDALIFDMLYEVKESDDIASIAYAFELSVSDILTYNNIKEKDIKPGMKLRIPTRYTNGILSSELNTKGSDVLEKPLLGIDISRYQEDKDIDWDALKNNISFAILKASQGNSVDSTFESKSVKFAELNIPIGAYCYNDYIKTGDPDFEANVKKQIDLFLKTISGKKIVYPVYLDIEGDVTLNKKELNYLLNSWYDAMTNAGYKPGIYADKSRYQDNIKKLYDGDLKDKFELLIAGDCEHFDEKGIWYSQGDGQATNKSYEKITKALEGLTPEKLYDVESRLGDADMVQITESGTSFGVGNSDGHVDVDVTFIDYITQAKEENVITDEEAKLLLTMTPDQKSKIVYSINKGFDDPLLGIGILIGMGLGVATAVAAMKLQAHQERKRRTKRGKTKIKRK